MDELAESLDKLNTNAKEWRPGQGIASSASSAPQSPAAGAKAGGGGNSNEWRGLQVGGVKEFVPSRGRAASWQHPQSHAAAGQSWRPEAISSANGGLNQQAQGSTNSIHVEDGIPYPPEEEVHDEDFGLAWWAQGASTTYSGQQRRRVRNLHSLGAPDLLWRYYRDCARETLREVEPTDPRIKAVPAIFGNVFCLDHDESSGMKAGSFGYPSQTFKVVSNEDGFLYCLRRFDNVKCLSPRITSTVTEKWSTLRHSGMCSLHKCFLSQRAAFFLHDYCPGAQTLQERFLNPQEVDNHMLLSERMIWSYVTQLVAVMRYIHGRGMACRSLHPKHVLITDGGGRRLRLSAVGVMDALEFEARKPMNELQMEDMVSLGHLIFSLATRTITTRSTDADTLHSCDAFVAQNFSPELHGLALALLDGRRQPPTVFDVCGMVSSHAWEELDVAHAECDAYNDQLSIEYESGRALRLLLKLGYINERPEFGVDRQWAETGDCYVLKLFRDYVFHQADASGNPVMDLGHVVSSLNKLEAADPEKIALASRDGKSLLVVSFADVARCLEQAYRELCQAEARYPGAEEGAVDPMGAPADPRGQMIPMHGGFGQLHHHGQPAVPYHHPRQAFPSNGNPYG